MFPKIGSLRVDLEALRGIAHKCLPERCRGRVTCCACYDVAVSRREASRIVGMLPEAARFAPRLRSDGSYIDPFDEGDGEGMSLAVNEADVCVLAYRTVSGDTLCSLHSAAVSAGLDPARVKPLSCALWPLALSDDRHEPTLTVQRGALAFPCNRTRRNQPGLDPGIAGIVRACFGEGFLRRLNACLAG